MTDAKDEQDQMEFKEEIPRDVLGIDSSSRNSESF